MADSKPVLIQTYRHCHGHDFDCGCDYVSFCGYDYRQASLLSFSYALPQRPCRKEPVRFDSFRFRSFLKFVGSVRFGSVRKIVVPGSTRFGLRFSDTSWLSPVRFGSFPRSVPSGSRVKRFGSVRPVRFGLLFLPERLAQAMLSYSSILNLKRSLLPTPVTHYASQNVADSYFNVEIINLATYRGFVISVLKMTSLAKY